jgi:hypothetical protein
MKGAVLYGPRDIRFKEREDATIVEPTDAILRLAAGKTEQMDFHFPNALTNGVTREEIIEMITQLASYAGWPNAISALNRAKALFAREGRP